MSRTADHFLVFSPREHSERMPHAPPGWRFEQMYTVPHLWALALLCRIVESHRVHALVREQRNTTRDVVVVAQTARDLSAVEADYRKLMPLLSVEIVAATDRLCAAHLRPVNGAAP
jgi:hypothetical protein